MTNRASITDLPNPAKRIAELESELERVRAALEDQHASTDALWNENTALRTERDALRARLQAVEAAARWACESWPARNENWIRADHEDAMEALTAAFSESEMTK